MSIEQKAEKYLKAHNYTGGYIGYFAEGYCRQAYIAGAKENGVVWHNLKENPDDLPHTPKDADEWKLVWGHDGNQWFYTENQKEWYTRNSYDNDWGSGCKALIAWAEIPTFEEKI